MALKDKLNYLKKLKGCTTGDIIESTNIPKGTLNKVLSGETDNPRMETVLVLRNYFNVTLDYLIDDSIAVKDVIYKDSSKNKPLIDIENLSDDKKQALKGYFDRLIDEN